MTRLHKIRSLLSFYFKGKTIYKVHSPFVFDFINAVFDTSRNFYAFEKIEQIRWSLSKSTDAIEFEDHGAKKKKPRNRKIKAIAKEAVSGKRKCRWLFNTVLRYRPKYILELGTSLGISSLYLSATDGTTLFTLEGDPNSAAIARKNFKQAENHRIHLIEGRFEVTLNDALKKIPSLDMVYMDGDHSYEGTLKYFHQCMTQIHAQSIIVFDDIYWSEGMTKAWNEIKKHPRIKLSIDLFQMGFIFFDDAIKEKQDFHLIDSPWKIWQKYLP